MVEIEEKIILKWFPVKRSDAPLGRGWPKAGGCVESRRVIKDKNIFLRVSSS